MRRNTGEPFFLLHRPRRWNPSERVWMGYERKRGKLADLNALLREGSRAPPAERFVLVVGDLSALAATSLRHYARHGHRSCPARPPGSSSARWPTR